MEPWNHDHHPEPAARGAAAPPGGRAPVGGRWGLIVGAGRAAGLLRRPRPGVTATRPRSAGHPVIHHDLSRLGFNFAEGLSNGAIWALIAIGYTLVYGIIELINFAHGDVFMIGSFTAVGFWAVFGLDARPRAPPG